MILLEKLLAGLNVRVRTFGLCLLEQGTALSLEALDLPSVHYSLTGDGEVTLSDGRRLAFKRHSFFVLPAGRSMIVRAGTDGGPVLAAAKPCTSISDGLVRMRAGEGAPDMVLACGRIEATYRGATGLFDHLTEPLVDDFACEDGVCRPFETLLSELSAPKPGTVALADGLMQQCLVLLLRRYCASGECRLPWLAALEEPRLAKAVDAMLADPAHDFSLEALADLVGMGRSAFVAHFHGAFGRAPIEFLKEVRLQWAAELLRTTDMPVKAVAPRVGYASRSYFSRAFKAHYGLDPAAYRKRA